MTETPSQTGHISFEDALHKDESWEQRWEYLEGHFAPKFGFDPETGEVVEGASARHVSLASQLLCAVMNRLPERPWRAGTSQLKVLRREDQAFAYPDVVVWRESALWDVEYPNLLLTPLIIAEILSPGTAEKDRGEKRALYLRFPSLFDYLILSPERVSIEHYRWAEQDSWIYRHLTSRDQTLRLNFRGLEIPVGEIYRRVDVPEQMIFFEPEES